MRFARCGATPPVSGSLPRAAVGSALAWHEVYRLDIDRATLPQVRAHLDRFVLTASRPVHLGLKSTYQTTCATAYSAPHDARDLGVVPVIHGPLNETAHAPIWIDERLFGQLGRALRLQAGEHARTTGAFREP